MTYLQIFNDKELRYLLMLFGRFEGQDSRSVCEINAQ